MYHDHDQLGPLGFSNLIDLVLHAYYILAPLETFFLISDSILYRSNTIG